MAEGADRPDAGGWLPPQTPGAPPQGAPPPESPYGAPPPPRQTGRWVPSWERPPEPDDPADPGNSLAVWGCGLGLASLGIMYFASPLLFLPALPFAIAGWVVSHQARQKIKRGETRKGRAWADGGYVIGISMTIITVLASIAVIVALILD